MLFRELEVKEEVKEEGKEKREKVSKKPADHMWDSRLSCILILPVGLLLRRGPSDIELQCYQRCAHHIRLGPQAPIKADAHVWLDFLQGFEGLSFWRTHWLSGHDFQVHSDAAGAHGFGIYFQGHWFTQHWPAGWECEGVLEDFT